MNWLTEQYQDSVKVLELLGANGDCATDEVLLVRGRMAKRFGIHALKGATPTTRMGSFSRHWAMYGQSLRTDHRVFYATNRRISHVVSQRYDGQIGNYDGSMPEWAGVFREVRGFVPRPDLSGLPSWHWPGRCVLEVYEVDYGCVRAVDDEGGMLWTG